MTRPYWVRPTGEHEAVAGAALEAGTDGVLVHEKRVETVESVGRLPIATLDEEKIDLVGDTAERVTIQDPGDQDQARAKLGTVDVLIIDTDDWDIIPLENLIAWANDSSTRLYAEVRTYEEAKTALTTLEQGTHGLVLATDDAALVKKIAPLLQDDAHNLELEHATITSIEDAGMGDRVCADTTSLLDPDEGLLVGSQSNLFCLVASEATEAGYVAARPFRVNAGAVHAYVLAPHDETRYLSEVNAGTPLLAVHQDGSARRVVTGRAKIERRPMLLVTIQTQDGQQGTIVLQNAETIRLITPDEGPESIAKLEPGDTVLAHRGHDTGRHFGAAIQETVHEA